MGGLHYESLSDLPPQMRKQVASKIVAKIPRPVLVAGTSGKEPKYHNKKVTAVGHTFDSQKEYRRYLQLMDALREGMIYDLRLQHNFTLIEGYERPDGERVRPEKYVADFTYRLTVPLFGVPTTVSFDDLEYWRQAIARRENDGLIIEDVKTRGTRTQTYINKYKMMADLGYTIREV